MSARYGDRFRPPEPTPDRASTSEVLDLGELGHRSARAGEHGPEPAAQTHQPGPPRPWHASWMVWLIVVAALLIGVGGGAYGWDRWTAHRADVAAQSVIELVAVTSSLGFPDVDKITVGVRYQNLGPRPIVINNVRFASNRLVPVGEPRPVTVDPGSTETQIFTSLLLCPDGAATLDPPRLTIEAETVSGSVRDEVIESGLDADILSWLGYACSDSSHIPAFAESYGEIRGVTASEDATAVRAVIVFVYPDEITQVHIDGVQAASEAFTAEHVVAEDIVSASITVELRVLNCALARDASESDMAIRVTGRYDRDKPSELSVFPNTPLAVELARMAERSCPEPSG